LNIGKHAVGKGQTVSSDMLGFTPYDVGAYIGARAQTAEGAKRKHMNEFRTTRFNAGLFFLIV